MSRKYSSWTVLKIYLFGKDIRLMRKITGNKSAECGYNMIWVITKKKTLRQGCILMNLFNVYIKAAIIILKDKRGCLRTDDRRRKNKTYISRQSI